MPRPLRSTNNSLLVGFPTQDSLPSSATSESPVTSTAPSPTLWFEQSETPFPPSFHRSRATHVRTFLLRFQAFLLAGLHNLHFLQRPIRVRVQVTMFLRWLQVRLPPFAPTFTPLSAMTFSSSARLVAVTPSTFVLPGVTSSLLSLESSFASPKSEKAFIVGLGHAPIPSKQVSKMVGGQFVESADLLSANLRAVEQEPQTILHG